MSLSIRFPMVREKTGYRRGARYRLTPDTKQLNGAAGCAARMIACAMRSRDSALRDAKEARTGTAVTSIQIDRAAMRTHALWARVFARQITQDDARVSAAEKRHTALVREFCRGVNEQSAAA